MSNASTTSDLVLFEQLKQHDAEAFRVLFRRYYRPLCGYVALMITNRAASEEIVQDVFADLWEKRERITVAISVKAYLYTSAKNRTLNFNKQKANRARVHPDELPDPACSLPTPEEQLSADELHRQFERAVVKLPEQARKVFILKRTEQLRQKEIAAALQISENMVEKHMTNALRHLRQSLAGFLRN